MLWLCKKCLVINVYLYPYKPHLHASALGGNNVAIDIDCVFKTTTSFSDYTIRRPWFEFRLSEYLYLVLDMTTFCDSSATDSVLVYSPLSPLLLAFLFQDAAL
jgi:hypothetical protein